MTNLIFPQQLAEDMYNTSVLFSRILHIPTLSVGDNVPDGFEDFLDSIFDKNGDDLIKDYPQFQNIFEGIKEYSGREWNSEHAMNMAQQCCDYEFLVLLEIAIPRNFKFNEEGKFQSCSSGGVYQMQWIFAKNMQHAAEQGIKLSEEIHNQEEQKARIEQGLEG